MKLGVLAAVLMLFVMQANAAKLVFKDGQGNSVHLLEEPCVSAPWLKEWRTASFVYQGKTYAACWRLQGQTVVLLDSAGDVTPIPAGAFENDPGV